MKFFDSEIETGNIEYKLILSKNMADEDRIQELASQMRYRLYEGNGEAFYYLGVSDNGNPTGIPDEEVDESIKNLEKVSRIAGAKIKILRKSKGNEGTIVEVFIRKEKNPNEIPPDIRIASVGNVDAGKSTFIGVLQSGDLDDGRGSARSQIFRYLHELETGRTSSVANTVIGFDIDGKIVNQDKVHHPTDIELLERSIKTITFVDLAGHEKYLRTTIFGLTGLEPNYAMLVVSANQGILQMTKEHLGLVVALKIPFFVVVTKIDITPEIRLKRTLTDLKKLLKIPGISKIPIIVKDTNDSVVSSLNLNKNSIVPIFTISAVKGQGLDMVTNFIQLLPLPQEEIELKNNINKEFRAYIDDIFVITGVGTVVSAMVYSGSIQVNQLAQLGPQLNGDFKQVRIKSMHYKRVLTSKAIAGQNVTFALHNVKREDVRKGMVLLSGHQSNGAVRKFEADIYVLYHSTTIRKGYSPVIHCRSIRQSAKFLELDKEYIRTGDKAKVVFEFLYRPEHIREGQRIIFREGRTKGLGIITKIIH